MAKLNLSPTQLNVLRAARDGRLFISFRIGGGSQVYVKEHDNDINGKNVGERTYAKLAYKHKLIDRTVPKMGQSGPYPYHLTQAGVEALAEAER